MVELKIKNAIKSFGWKQILAGIDLHCATGDIIGVFGRNGSGKSTLLKMVFGTLKANSLELKVDGESVRPRDVIHKRLIGYLPQDPFLPKHLKVRDIIPLYFEDGVAQDEIFRSPFVESMAAKKVGVLSLGELRYLELILVGNLNHPFLMLDEPFSMIEPLYKEKIKEFLLRLKAKKGIILTDHYYDDVLSVSTANYILLNGKLREVKDEEGLRKAGYLRG